MTQSENIERFEQLMASFEREGKEELLKYIREKTDFFVAPASTKFHLSCEGGLLQHSLNVYDCLIAKKNSPIWGKILEKVPDESLIIMSLLHDLCKVNFYVKGTRNQKTYDPEKVSKVGYGQKKHDEQGDFIWETVMSYQVEDTIPLGHGEKSVILINRFMRLNAQEIFAIRWHMGFSADSMENNTVGKAMEKFPIVLALYEADMEATKILEDVSGNRE